MPILDVPWRDDNGVLVGRWRVEAKDATEAAKKAQAGQGEWLNLDIPRPGPGENPIIAPPNPPPPDATVYNPPGPPRTTEEPLLAPVFNWIGETVLPKALDVARPAILPTTLGAAANYGGAAVPGLSALPPQARESIGSVVGTGINMLTGIEQPSLSGLAMSAVSPGATRRGARAVTSVIPGVPAARATGLREEALALSETMRQGLTTEGIDQLFASARQSGARIPMTETRTMLDTLLAREVEQPRGWQFASVRDSGAELQGMLASSASQGGPPIAQLDAWRRRLGARIKVTKDTEEQQALRSLYGSVITDLEAAADQIGGDAALALRNGISQSRRMFSADDLHDLVEGATSKEREGDLLRRVDFGGIKKTLERPRTEQQTLLSQFLDEHPEERADLMNLLDDMNRRNVKLLPPPGSTFGSGGVLARGGAGYLAAKGINAVAGTEVLDPQTTGVAVGAGSVILSKLMMTPAGRAAIRQMYADTGTLNVMQLLTQFGGQAARANLGPPAVDLAQRVSTRATGFPGYPAEEQRQP